MPRRLPKVFFEKSHPKVLVAGGAGFVGSHLCEELLRRGCEVFCLDNWLTGIKQNVKDLKDQENFHLVEHDITQGLPKELPNPDYIFHAAGVEAYLNGEDLSVETLLVNSQGTENLLALAEKTGARFLLLSTADIFEGRVSLASLRDYFGQEGRGGAFSHHEAKRFSEALTAQYFRQKKVDARVVRISQVFGPRMILTTGNVIANLVKAAIYSKNLEIPHPGSQKIYPVFVSKAAEQIIRFMFSPGSKGAIRYLVGKPVTVFEFAQSINRASGKSLEIVTTTEEYEEPVLPQDLEFIQGDLDEEAAETLAFFEEHMSAVPKPKRQRGREKKKKREIKLSFPNSKRLFLVTVGVFVFAFFALPVLQLLFGAALLFGTKQSLEAGMSDMAGVGAYFSQSSLAAAKRGFARFGILPLAQAAETLEITSRTAQKAAKVASLSQSLASGVFGQDPYEVDSLSKQLSLSLSDLSQELSFLQAEIGEGTALFLPSKNLSRYREILDGLSKVSAQLPSLLGTQEKKTYLLLLQNNMELRPTGGFIGSFALATFEEGRLIDLKVQDVYQADGQLAGHVEPPEPIREYLGEANWYLRDSNWDPHFPTSAARAAWFLDKELNVPVDGVIGVDLEFAKRLVAELGPLEIEDFDERITADNLYERTQYRAEANFFPGSSQKKDFLTAVLRTLLSQATSTEQQKWTALAKATLTSLEERHLQIYLANQEAQKAFSSLFWDGGIKSASCPVANCQTSSLLLVEANLGVNKANYFLKRAQTLNVSLSAERLLFQLDISYTNNSKVDTWPGGTYKNYLRAFVPKEAELVSATVADPNSQNKDPLEASIAEERGFSVFGFLLQVPPGQTRILSLSWQTKSPFDFVSPGQFLFFWQKQAGVRQDPLVLRLHYPEELELAVQPKPSLTELGVVSYNMTLARDIKTQLVWPSLR